MSFLADPIAVPEVYGAIVAALVIACLVYDARHK